METKGKKRGAARIRKVFNRKSQFGRSEAVQFARMGFFLNVTRRSSPVSPRFEPPLPPQPSFLPSFRSVQPRFARFRDSFVTKKLNSSRRDVHPPLPFPILARPSLSLSPTISIHRPRRVPSFLNGAARSVFRVSYSSIVRQFLHMPTAEVTHPRLLSSLPFSSFERCRPPDIPPRLKGPNCESVDRKNSLARNQRTVRCIPRAYKNAISSFPPLTFDYPSDRSTHPFLLHDSYLPSNVCVFITVASGGQVDAREGRDRSSRSSHPRRASIEYRRQGRIRTWNLVRCFRWGRGDTLPSNNSSTASRLFTIDGIISSALKRPGGSVERFYLFFFLRVLIYSFSLSLSFFSR